MEPIKLENQIREKLNAREIQPSAQSWDRLDAMLSVAEEKKTKRPFGFLFVAASILVLVSLGIFFFTQNGSKIQPENNVVTTETKDTLQKPLNEIPTPIVEQKQIVVSTDIQNPTRGEAEQSESISQTTNNNQRVSISNQKSINREHRFNGPSNQNSLINRDKQIEFQNSSDVALKELPKIETRKQIIVSNKNIPSDEQLLAALDKMASQSTKSKSTLQVDAKSLLSQVDGELELTFREKVINKVNKNYREVKVALANRNKE